MHPAASVIFFTVSSGIGYGLLALLGALGAAGLLPADPAFGVVGIALALIAVTAGLLSSTFHLGHPERAWRAFSQWRSSWLSREGVAAVITYGPAVALAGIWFWPEELGVYLAPVGIVSAVMALATIYCTAMIYRSLKTIPEWANTWTVVNYLLLGIAGGAVWLLALMGVFGHEADHFGTPVVALLVLAWIVKHAYWSYIDNNRDRPTMESATGLGRYGTVRKFEAPHTEANYLLDEMGYQVGRRHAVKLRLYAQALTFLIPIVLVLTAPDGNPAPILLAAVSVTLGLLIERWLVFAQARHVVTLFYGRRPN